MPCCQARAHRIRGSATADSTGTFTLTFDAAGVPFGCFILDPRLLDESIDWCARFGKSFLSISRLRQLTKLIPPDPKQHRSDLPSMLLNGTALSEGRRLSHKSRQPSLDQPSLLQLRSRYVFGVGARADVLAGLAMQGRRKGGQRISEIRPSGYTKAAVSTVLDELAQAEVLTKLSRATSVRYELAREVPLRSLLAPLPRAMPRWAERYSIVATILEAWRAFGSRKTYAVELAKVLDGIRHLAASAEGTFGFDPAASKERALLNSIEFHKATPHFDMGD